MIEESELAKSIRLDEEKKVRCTFILAEYKLTVEWIFRTKATSSFGGVPVSLT